MTTDELKNNDSENIEKTEDNHFSENNGNDSFQQQNPNNSDTQKAPSCIMIILKMFAWAFAIAGPLLLVDYIQVMPLHIYSDKIIEISIALTIIETIIFLIYTKAKCKGNFSAYLKENAITYIVVGILLLPNIYCSNHIIIRLLNSYLDFSEPTIRYVQVEDIIHYQATTTRKRHIIKLFDYYHYRISSWIKSEKYLEIPEESSLIRKGDICRVETKPGFLGMEFVSKITKDEFPPKSGNYPMTEAEHDKLAPMKRIQLDKYHTVIIKNKALENK